MALSTPTKTTPKTPEAPQTITMELALYSTYTFQGHTFVKGQPYAFNRDVAMVLMSERDCDRPVWKVYQPKKQVVKQAPKVEDATQVVEPVAVDLDPTATAPSSRRIDVGSDDEIKDLLPTDDGGGNVTV